MNLLFFGGIPIALGIIAGYFWYRQQPVDPVKVSGLTILTYRIFTAATIYFYGGTDEWRRIAHDNLNHYEIGVVIIAATLVLRKSIGNKAGKILRGIGTGMIIDEVSEVLTLLGMYDFGKGFRDTWRDMVLIGITWGIWAAGIKTGQKMIKYKAKLSGEVG